MFLSLVLRGKRRYRSEFENSFAIREGILSLNGIGYFLHTPKYYTRSKQGQDYVNIQRYFSKFLDKNYIAGKKQ